MKKCHCCRGPFGLIRHYYNRHSFCRLKCVAAYQEKLQRMIAVKKQRASVIRAWRAA